MILAHRYLGIALGLLMVLWATLAGQGYSLERLVKTSITSATIASTFSCRRTA